jgi:hypothetical protein
MRADQRPGERFVAEIVGRPQDRPALRDRVDPLFEQVAKVPRRTIGSAEIGDRRRRCWFY